MTEAIESASDDVLKSLNEFRRFSGNHEDFIAYNRAFHSALAHASGNRRMAAALCDLIGQADRLVRVSVANLKGHDPAKLVAEHVALIEAMQRRDGRTAARLIKAHIAQTEKRVLPALKRNAVIVEGRDTMNIPSKPGAIDVEIHGNFVDGREVEAGYGEMLDVRNPATGDVIARIPNSTADDIDRAMKSARAAFEGKAWGGMDIARARAAGQSARGRLRGQSGYAVPAGDAQQRPPGQRDPRAALAAAGFLPLLRRRWRWRAATPSSPSKARI